MSEIRSSGLRPFAAIAAITSYVAHWPFRHIHGGAWLRVCFASMLNRSGTASVRRYYGLEFRDASEPPRVTDLALVTLMQTLILCALISTVWVLWILTNDYIWPAFMAFSVFHLVPSSQDFLTEGSMARSVPNWISPITSALSFVVSLPAMIIALPAAIIWGLLGVLKSIWISKGVN